MPKSDKKTVQEILMIKMSVRSVRTQINTALDEIEQRVRSPTL